jgi:iron-sulfur cluster insertion protein
MGVAVTGPLPAQQRDKVVFTPAAAAKVKGLLDKEETRDSCLRVYVTGGGCSGFQYGFKLDREASGDTRIETDGVVLVVDPMSLQYLKGGTVDYVVNLQGSQFVVQNPNAATTCGCGLSFAV